MFVGSPLVSVSVGISAGISINAGIGIAALTSRTALGIPIRHVRGDAEPAPLQSPIVTAKLLGEHSLHSRPVSVSCAALNCKAMRLSTSRT